MNDPIAPLTPALPLASVRGAKAQAEAPVGAAAEPGAFGAAPVTPAAPSPAPAQSPVALSVDRDASGVFVYTLTDRGTGQVLAVIPRALTQSPAGKPGGEVDIQA